jgi:hypothetical protein
MEQTDTTEEKTFRLNFKQNSKGNFYAEWTCRSNSFDELKARNELIREYALDQLKKLNVM